MDCRMSDVDTKAVRMCGGNGRRLVEQASMYAYDSEPRGHRLAHVQEYRTSQVRHIVYGKVLESPPFPKGRSRPGSPRSTQKHLGGAGSRDGHPRW